jgi:hypothetical protein
MIQFIRLNQQEMKENLPIFQKTETPGRLTVKLNREVGGLLVTVEGTESEMEEYFDLLRKNGITI